MSNPYGQNPGDPQNPYGGQPAADAPGIGLGKVGFILACIPCVSNIGLILSIVAFFQSKSANVPNTKARNGIIVGIAWIVLSIILYVIGIAVGLASGGMSTY
ncbi:hypothetical protein GC722_10215 [Auraticoccus sp. F435]|uniref:DUF4190 domain-containing protein n=1 Tax=Auraticoccus cholistanensis TaxID=2656650 RepID=A0A6A9UXR1_9ACTN|nr:hypothetical protein [Auraticoccus cholistanensis]MVA76394.1 hypothetical protein [Auraticoccus cholistanensis]